MMRFLCAAILLGSAASFWGCGSTEEDDRADAVMERAVFLFGHYSEAQKKQDAQMLSVVRGDLKRLNVESFPVLLKCLASKDTEVQGYAAFTLGFSGHRGAIAPLAAETNNPDETVRGNAIAALGQLGFADAPIEPFQRLLKDPLPEVRHATLYGLTSMVGPKDDRGMLDAVHEALGDPDAHVRTEALIVLRKMRRKDSVAVILGTVVKDPEPQVRSAAALALAGIGREAKEATPFLVEMLKDDYHRVVEGAWVALNKIHEKDFDRSYSTWRDWYEDEQKVVYTCLQHPEVTETSPGVCPKCRVKLERISREGVRKTAQADPAVVPTPALYVCPEHAEILTTSPAKCGKPGCGKELVPKKPDPVTYTCPEHAEILTTTPAKCGKPGCGKDLIPKK
jgi:vesicle coat complex subunit